MSTVLKKEIAKQNDLVMQLYKYELKGEHHLNNEQHTKYNDCFIVLNDVILKNKKKSTVSKKLMKQIQENTLFFQQLLEQQ